MLIAGERHSGTTYVKALLASRLCFKQALHYHERMVWGQQRWKHDLVDVPRAAQKLTGVISRTRWPIVFVAVTRAPYAWLAAMWLEPLSTRYDASGRVDLRRFVARLRGRDDGRLATGARFADFVLAPWDGRVAEVPPRAYAFDSLVAMRTAKLRAFRKLEGALAAGSGVHCAAFLHVNYEEALREPERVLAGVARARGRAPPLPPLRGEFASLPRFFGSQVDARSIRSREFDAAEARERTARVLRGLTPAQLRRINAQLDCDVEASFGYKLLSLIHI